MLQDHRLNDRDLKEKGVHGEREHQRAATNRRPVGAVMATTGPPPWPVSPAIPSECAVTQGALSPGVTAWPRFAGARPGPTGYPGAGRDAPAHRPSRERHQRGRRYMGPEPPLGSTDAFMSGGGRQAPPPDPWPPSLATR